MHNWIQQYDLLCAPALSISAIGSFYFLGTFIGSIFMNRLGDTHGRKPVFLFGVVLTVVTMLGLMYASSIQILYFMLTLGGISNCGSNYVGYVYAVEVVPIKNRNFAGLFVFLCFSLMKVSVCLFFW